MDYNNPVDWFLLTLSIDALLVIWLKGSIFAARRAKLETIESSSKNWAFKLLAEGLLCSKCLPIHLALWLFLFSLLGTFCKSMLFIVAASGLASRLYNDIWPDPLLFFRSQK